MHFFHLRTAGYPQPHLIGLRAPLLCLAQGSKGQMLETQGEKLIMRLCKEEKKKTTQKNSTTSHSIIPASSPGVPGKVCGRRLTCTDAFSTGEAEEPLQHC